MKLSKLDAGKRVTYLGSDSVRYQAQIIKVLRGIAVIEYRIRSGELIRGYIDSSRFSSITPAAAWDTKQPWEAI